MEKLNQQLNNPAKVWNFGRVNRFQLFPTTRLINAIPLPNPGIYAAYAAHR